MSSVLTWTDESAEFSREEWDRFKAASSGQVYPLPDDEFYTIPKDDAVRLLKFLQHLNAVGLDEEGWYNWFVGFMGAPTSIGSIDQLGIAFAVGDERNRCLRIARSCTAKPENVKAEIALRIKRGK